MSILGFEHFAPGKSLQIRLNHSDGTSETFDVQHTYNDALNKIRTELGVE